MCRLARLPRGLSRLLKATAVACRACTRLQVSRGSRSASSSQSRMSRWGGVAHLLFVLGCSCFLSWGLAWRGRPPEGRRGAAGAATAVGWVVVCALSLPKLACSPFLPSLSPSPQEEAFLEYINQLLMTGGRRACRMHAVPHTHARTRTCTRMHTNFPSLTPTPSPPPSCRRGGWAAAQGRAGRLPQ